MQPTKHKLISIASLSKDLIMQIYILKNKKKLFLFNSIKCTIYIKILSVNNANDVKDEI